MAQRIYIFGASGSGVTTLGASLADAINAPFFDSDDYGWQPSSPPFQERYPIETRVQNLHTDLDGIDHWVLGGSLWSREIMCTFPFTLVVFLYVDTKTRLKRLQQREIERFGIEAEPGGSHYEQSQTFLNWAASYDDGPMSERSLSLHRSWMEDLPFASLSLETEASTESQVEKILEALSTA